MTSAPPRVPPAALVTGGAKRVGRAICLALAEAGCAVRFTYNISDDASRGTLEDLRAIGIEAHADRLDLGDADAVEQFGSKLAATGRPLDILIHNASVYARASIEEVSAKDYERTHRVNALSPLLLTKALAPRLKQSRLGGGGAVVAMCDIHALGIPRSGFSAYSMSKAALAEMVRSLAVELAPHVRVNGVAPGVVAWPEEGHESDAKSQQQYLSRVPLARAGTPEDAAEAVRWLALHARYTTGQIIRIDGGRSLR